jgi:HK97 family phage prohead protease
MEYTLEQVIKSLSERHATDRWGIGIAAHYVKSVCPLFDCGDLSPAKAFSLADPSMWVKELEDAAKRLTYCDPVMADPDYITKSFREGTEIASGAVAEFDCVVTSRRKDRDGDVLEASGMVVDKNSPLLWQHIQLQPIGKHLTVISQDEDRIVSKLAIADTAMGRDAAVLAKFGALRISQGFRPTKLEPIEIVKNAKGQEVVKGWHVKQGEIMEISLVSIPANTDAVITAFSQNKLHAPLVKSWAKQYFDARPVQIPVNIELKVNGQLLSLKGGDTEKLAADTVTEPATPEVTVVEEAKPADTPTTQATATDTPAADKSIALQSLMTKMLWGAIDDELKGSFEWIQSKLRVKAEDYLKLKGKQVDRGYVALVATYADYAIVCYRPWSESESKCYRLAWEISNDMPTWTGDPVDVEITAEVREKFIEAPFRKNHPTLDDTRKKFGRLIASLSPVDALNALEPFVGLHSLYAEQKKSSEWGEFASSLK